MKKRICAGSYICSPILQQKNFAAAGVVLDKNSKALHTNFERRWAIYNYAPGRKPSKPLNANLFRVFGRATGKLHAALDDYQTVHDRFAWDLKYLLEDPLPIVATFLDADDMSYIRDLAGRMKSYIENHMDELDWGSCHGDLTPDNIHIDTNGLITFYDFDSGGMGWRAAEFRDIWWRQQQLQDGCYDAFIEGYKSARSMSEINYESVPFFLPAYEIWGFAMDWEHGHVQDEPGGKSAYIKRKMKKLYDWENIVKSLNGRSMA